jgi:hypothetical protein
MPDVIIRDLVKKKKGLLDELLRESIQSMINEPYLEKAMVSRERILVDLKRTDESLQTREEQTGVQARQQEPVLFEMIGQTITSIQDNNEETIRKIEQVMKEAESERSILGRERRLSGYIQKGQGHRKNRAVASL